MLEALLKEIEDKGDITIQINKNSPTYKVILVDLVTRIIKKHVTIENAEKWLEEQKEKNQNS